MSQYTLKIKIEGEVIVQADSKEHAELLVQYTEPHLSQTKIIRSKVEVLEAEKRDDIVIEPNNVTMVHGMGSDTQH